MRSNVFAMNQVPHIDKVFDMITQDVNQKRGVWGETSAMYSNVGNQGKYNNSRRNGAGKGKYNNSS